MKAIRGATTIARDEVGEIKDKVSELLGCIVSGNGLEKNDIICIMLSSTGDIKSMYPAKAAREAGFSSCALYSSLEPDIEDALPLHFKDATILADSETCLLRPSSAAAPFGNVTIVGDWISTGLPATIESAAMSAHIDISR